MRSCDNDQKVLRRNRRIINGWATRWMRPRNRCFMITFGAIETKEIDSMFPWEYTPPRKFIHALPNRCEHLHGSALDCYVSRKSNYQIGSYRKLGAGGNSDHYWASRHYELPGPAVTNNLSQQSARSSCFGTRRASSFKAHHHRNLSNVNVKA